MALLLTVPVPAKKELYPISFHSESAEPDEGLREWINRIGRDRFFRKAGQIYPKRSEMAEKAGKTGRKDRKE